MSGQDGAQRKPIRLIAAACNNMGIGKDGRLPWSIPSEFKFFLDKITAVSKPGKKNLLVWGRYTWFSCPEGVLPLANTLHVILTKKLRSPPELADYICEDFDEAIRLASQPPLSDLIETIWVIGGTEVYREAMEHPWCDLIYLTDIMADFDCDVFFPDFDRNIYRKQSRFPGVPDEIQEENGIKFQFQVFKKMC
ncbi:dihydrofolate reductase-like isoform X1 [Astyanax mexicanus]|uniref:dihydrofolate reductase n=1 Tax=Astyanax mexicanus TaxID=7994 RepID=A0A8B9L8F6_ASTMX|nr:dihydrofolate reductase-like isoform X1 [Astyanax mexicanus]